MDIISYKRGTVTFMLSFPFIRRRYEFKTIQLIESPRQLLLPRNNFEKFHSFLMPMDIPLDNVSSSLSFLRSTENCIKTRSFTACDGNSMLSYEERICMGSLLGNAQTHCHHRDVPIFDFHVEYASENALIYLRNGSKIVNATNGDVRHEGTGNIEKCVFIAKRPNLKVESPYRIVQLFQSKSFPSIRIKVEELTYSHFMEPTVIENFTTPSFNRTKVYVPVVLDEIAESEILELIAIVLSSIVFLILLLIFIKKFGYWKRTPSVNGNDLFPSERV